MYYTYPLMVYSLTSQFAFLTKYSTTSRWPLIHVQCRGDQLNLSLASAQHRGKMIMNGCGQKENDGRQYSPFNMSQQADTKHCYLSYTSAHTNSLTTGQMYGHNNCQDSSHIRDMHRVWRHCVSNFKAQFFLHSDWVSHTGASLYKILVYCTGTTEAIYIVYTVCMLYCNGRVIIRTHSLGSTLCCSTSS